MRTTLPIVILGLAGGVALNWSARADDLYNTLNITDDRLYDRSFGNCIGSPPDSGIRDLQLADDFVLDSPRRLTAVTADYFARFPVHQLQGVWVQIFEDLGGVPSDEMHADYIASGAEISAIDLGTLPNGAPPNDWGARISADISAAGIELPAGTWWISIQPIDVGEGGNWYWILRDYGQVIGASDAGRNGGTHHTGTYGGYPGVLIYDNWQLLSAIGFRGGTSPMRIQGNIPCPADFNADGGVDGADVEAFFTAWGAGDSAGDVNQDGGVDGADVETFFSAWEAGGC